ncbi:hypothetical protein LCGC14_1691440 [marine sediment metagenome]|uniref:ATP-dependent DNA ligase family profile domain-containing protein n=1 Tax=marine sediment metagenome TaxID=412755 RepID=A0A0F9KKS0_9ZZZZ
MNELKDLQELVNELNTTNSSNTKKDILSVYPQCTELLKWTYNPFAKFNVTSKNLKKQKDLILSSEDLMSSPDIYDGILPLLYDLSERNITGHVAISCVNEFIENNKEYEKLIYCIIDKNLKTRTDASLINKVYPKLVPQFNVALPKKYEDYMEKIDFINDDWYVSRKLDGVRVVVKIKSANDIKFFSRKGIEFFTLEKVADEIKNTMTCVPMVLDGEICLIDKNGNESFSGLMKILRKKDYTMEHPRLKTFDILTFEDFDSKEGKKFTFSDRFPIEDLFGNSEILTYVEQKLVRSDAEVQAFVEYAVSQGWEGAVLRKDVLYKGKRSSDVLKVKKFFDAEYIINDVEMNVMRVIDNETGIEIDEEMLASVKIEHKGKVVSVGSGFNLKERRKYFKNPELIIGKTITVKYFEETLNKKGELSLKHGTKKHIHLYDRD